MEGAKSQSQFVASHYVRNASINQWLLGASGQVKPSSFISTSTVMPKPKKSNASKKQKLSQATLEEIFKGAGQTKKSKSKRDVNASESELGEKSDEGLGDIHFERKSSAVTTDDDVDALEVSSPKRSLKRRKVVNSDDDQDQPMPPLSSPTSHIQITDSEEDEVIPIRKSKRSKQNVVADSDDDDARPRKRKLRKKPQSPTTSDEDLAGEVEEERAMFGPKRHLHLISAGL